MLQENYHKRFNIKLVAKLQGGLLLVESLFFLLCAAVAFYYREETIKYFLLSFAISAVLGICGMLYGRKASTYIGKREGAIVVTVIWVIFSFIGMLPYWLSGGIPSFTDAFFETISGFTTTGVSIMPDIEVLPKSLLIWRSVTHWIGGLGIIVITMAVLPIFGFTGSQIYTAEVTGINKEKIHPKVSGTAQRLLRIYIGFSVLNIACLYFAGMPLFDAACNALSTISTGGFSNKNASISYWHSPAIEWVTIVFMTIAGINFSLFYFLITGKRKKFFKDEEMRVYLTIIVVTTIIVMFSLIDFQHFSLTNFGENLRNSIFSVTSLITTTGFYSVDYSSWVSVSYFLLLLTFIGGCAGSTAGGVKVIRVLLVFKYCYYEFKRMIHPNAVFPVRYNNVSVKEAAITKMLAYLLLYVILSLVGSAVLCFTGFGFEESISTMVSCLGNVGPGLGHLGPIDNYSAIPVFSKWFLSFAMLVGRLEFFTVLLIFIPAFWKK